VLFGISLLVFFLLQMVARPIPAVTLASAAHVT